MIALDIDSDPEGVPIDDGASIVGTQGVALQVFAGQYRRSIREDGSPLNRAVAADGYRKASQALTKAEFAIVTMVAVNGRTMGEVAARTGRPAGELLELLFQAAEKLAAHYETGNG